MIFSPLPSSEFIGTHAARTAAVIIFFVAALSGFLDPANAAEPSRTAAPPPRSIAAAQRNLEIATLRLLNFDRVEFPLESKRLDSEIALTRAAIKSLERRIVEYEQFTKNRYSSPLFLSLETTRLELVEARLNLKVLTEEKCLRIQYRGSTRRLYQLEIEQAHDRLESIRHEKNGLASHR